VRGVLGRACAASHSGVSLSRAPFRDMRSLNNILKLASPENVLQMVFLRVRRETMRKFWAYENWRANGHCVKVHEASCRCCNGGIGQRGGTRADNGKWHELGVFASTEEAVESARRRLGINPTRLCALPTCSA
jgi:hypothetical protein